MSKIQAYQEAKGRLAAFKQFMESAERPSCDKFGARVTINDTYQGHYGNSSCIGWPDMVVSLTEEDLRHQFFNSFQRSIHKLTDDVERARKAAEDEAREVLMDTKREGTV